MNWKESLQPSKVKVSVSLISGFTAIYLHSWTYCLGGSLCPINPFQYAMWLFKDFFPLGLVLITLSLVVSGVAYIVGSLLRWKFGAKQ